MLAGRVLFTIYGPNLLRVDPNIVEISYRVRVMSICQIDKQISRSCWHTLLFWDESDVIWFNILKWAYGLGTNVYLGQAHKLFNTRHHNQNLPPKLLKKNIPWFWWVVPYYFVHNHKTEQYFKTLSASFFLIFCQISKLHHHENQITKREKKKKRKKTKNKKEPQNLSLSFSILSIFISK